MREKKKVAELVEKNEPFVYTSGKYPAEFEKTTVVVQICGHPKRQGCAIVYDLRHDPADWIDKTAEQLAEAWRYKKDSSDPRLPVKFLQYNHCPAVAPLGVLDDASRQRLKIDLAVIKKHAAVIKKAKDLASKLCEALELMEQKTQTQSRLVTTEQDVDGGIYDGFFGQEDKAKMSVVRAAIPTEFDRLGLKFQDERLKALLPLYKARNFPGSLSGEERQEWERFRKDRLLSGGQHSKLAKYFTRLQEVVAKGGLTGHQEYLIEELKLYAESIMPEPED
jgi:exodeoxyribonuclease-1